MKNFKEGYKDQILGYSIFKKEDLEAIHNASMDILETVGVRVPGAEAHAVYRAAGCQVDEETDIVKFPRALVEECINSVPATFTMYGRDPKYDFVVGDGSLHYLNFGTGVSVKDIDTGEVRPTTKQDVADIIRFMDGLPEIELLHVPVTAGDVKQYYKDLHEGEAILLNTLKPFVHHNTDGKNTRRWVEMCAAVAGGKDKLREKPFTIMVVCPNSPLEITGHVGEIIIESAKAGLPINCLSMALAGGTSPTTLPGTLVVTNCEFMAGMVLAQLVNKGNPMIYGSSTTIMDMITATSPVGAPELALVGAGVAQMGKYYGIPAYCGGT
jgi:trimethylamine--corrinoid protein Co-methyltransferase